MLPTFFSPYTRSYGVFCTPATGYTGGATGLGIPFPLPLFCVRSHFGVLCLPLSWCTPFLLSHIIKYLLENKYKEIKFFCDLGHMLKCLFNLYTWLIIFSLNILVLVSSFRFKCSCPSVTQSLCYFFGNRLLCVYSIFSFQCPTPHLSLRFFKLLSISHIFVLIYWEISSNFSTFKFFPCFKITFLTSYELLKSFSHSISQIEIVQQLLI